MRMSRRALARALAGKVDSLTPHLSRRSNPLLDLSTGLVADPHELLRRLLATLHAHEYLGPPAEDFEELCVASSLVWVSLRQDTR